MTDGMTHDTPTPLTDNERLLLRGLAKKDGAVLRALQAIESLERRLSETQEKLAAVERELSERRLRDFARQQEFFDMQQRALAAEAERDEAKRNEAAIRELMNCYNLSGWTDAESAMKRALAAEALVGELQEVMQDAADMIKRCDYTPARSRLLDALAKEPT